MSFKSLAMSCHILAILDRLNGDLRLKLGSKFHTGGV